MMILMMMMVMVMVMMLMMMMTTTAMMMPAASLFVAFCKTVNAPLKLLGPLNAGMPYGSIYCPSQRLNHINAQLYTEFLLFMRMHIF